MSIHLHPASHGQHKRHSRDIEPLLLPKPQRLYLARQQRLHALAQHSDMADYLLFAAHIAGAQHQLQQQLPFDDSRFSLHHCLHQAKEHNRPALDLCQTAPQAHWQQLLSGLIEQLRPHLSGTPGRVLAGLQACPAPERWQMAQALLNYQFSSALSDKAPFIWAALSLCWSQMAASLPATAQAQPGENRQFCPVCGCMPVAGIIQGAARQGLRYLHCALCETQWHMVRVKCSNCEHSHALSYYSLDSQQAAVKCETCDHCGSYLKLLYLDQQPEQEVVADDLASLILDLQMEQHGYGRSAFNPLLFPAQ